MVKTRNVIGQDNRRPFYMLQFVPDEVIIDLEAVPEAVQHLYCGIDNGIRQNRFTFLYHEKPLLSEHDIPCSGRARVQPVMQ